MTEEVEKKEKKSITGKVVSNSMEKTVTVSIERRLRHPLYNKYIYKTTKILVHDEEMVSKVGDIVSIQESKPISKNKSWILNKVIETSQAE
ncbi:MAG: 30S ribosomal protein S17 [Gammaproteobacteria bacterium]|jgi:small subunit ribosomal protein S17|nr:30S ribosomal protein S17 [Gammaproteobacteria bacterium]|tara:strand:+ start:167 stop:439 length:273 start_codon:yes stop_codon:yes gene_type:complete